MLLTWQGETVTVRQNGHSVAITAVDEVERGGLSVEKQDTITGSTPQGDAIFEVSPSKSSTIPGTRHGRGPEIPARRGGQDFGDRLEGKAQHGR